MKDLFHSLSLNGISCPSTDSLQLHTLNPSLRNNWQKFRCVNIIFNCRSATVGARLSRQIFPQYVTWHLTRQYAALLRQGVVLLPTDRLTLMYVQMFPRSNHPLQSVSAQHFDSVSLTFDLVTCDRLHLVFFIMKMINYEQEPYIYYYDNFTHTSLILKR